MSETKRMDSVIQIHVDKVIATCTPLLPDVTKEELYLEEMRLVTEFGKVWLEYLKSCGVEVKNINLSLVKDHEPIEEAEA